MLEVLVSLVLVLSLSPPRAQTAFEVPRASVLRDTSAA